MGTIPMTHSSSVISLVLSAPLWPENWSDIESLYYFPPLSVPYLSPGGIGTRPSSTLVSPAVLLMNHETLAVLCSHRPGRGVCRRLG